jgi:hypothetical protein
VSILLHAGAENFESASVFEATKQEMIGNTTNVIFARGEMTA